MCCMFFKRAVYAKQIGTDDQAASAARRIRPDAGSESIEESEARYQGSSTFDGTLLCQEHSVRL